MNTYFKDRAEFLGHLAQRRRDLDALAEFVEANPDLPVPYTTDAVSTYQVQVSQFDGDPVAEMARLARLLSPCQKQVQEGDEGGYIQLIRPFGSAVFEAWTVREAVCERVVVGTESVEVPDPDAPMVTETREIVRWECSPILAGGEAESA